jgi:hypothetical protein
VLWWPATNVSEDRAASFFRTEFAVNRSIQQRLFEAFDISEKRTLCACVCVCGDTLRNLYVLSEGVKKSRHSMSHPESEFKNVQEER